MTTATLIELPGNKATVLPRNYIAVSLNTVRFIYRCKNKACKHVWACDYRKVYYDMGGRVGSGYLMRYEAPRYDLYRISDGEQKSIHTILCPLCGHIGDETLVKGKVSEHKCDARCQSAKNGDCECSCGGANHGINYIH